MSHTDLRNHTPIISTLTRLKLLAIMCHLLKGSWLSLWGPGPPSGPPRGRRDHPVWLGLDPLPLEFIWGVIPQCRYPGTGDYIET